MFICRKDIGLLTMEVSALSSQSTERKQKEKVTKSQTGSGRASVFQVWFRILFHQNKIL